MGRIHRYGQKRERVAIINLVAGKTREGRVIKTLLDKLEEIRKQLGSDKVFDVVGRIFGGMSITDYIQRAVESDDEADRKALELAGQLTPEQIKAIEVREQTIYGKGGEVLTDLPQLRHAMAIEEMRRRLPGYVRRFEMLATALVQPSTDPDDIKARDAEVERIAVEVVIAFEAAQDSDVRDVSTPPKARLAGLDDYPCCPIRVTRRSATNSSSGWPTMPSPAGASPTSARSPRDATARVRCARIPRFGSSGDTTGATADWCGGKPAVSRRRRRMAGAPGGRRPASTILAHVSRCACSRKARSPRWPAVVGRHCWR